MFGFTLKCAKGEVRERERKRQRLRQREREREIGISTAVVVRGLQLKPYHFHRVGR